MTALDPAFALIYTLCTCWLDLLVGVTLSPIMQSLVLAVLIFPSVEVLSVDFQGMNNLNLSHEPDC